MSAKTGSSRASAGPARHASSRFREPNLEMLRDLHSIRNDQAAPPFAPARSARTSRQRSKRRRKSGTRRRWLETPYKRERAGYAGQMSRATISHTKNHLSAMLLRVQKGETIVILDRERPVARLVPIDAESSVAEDGLRRLEAEGLVRRATSPQATFTLPTPVNLVGGGDILEALLADRDASR